MIIVFVLLLLLIPFLMIGILYPDDPDNRRARTMRALVATATYSACLGVSYSVAASLLYGLGEGVFGLTFIVGILGVSAVPLSAAERVAGLFGPRRSRLWAMIGMTICLAWSGLLYLLAGGGDPNLPRAAAIVVFTIPGIVAGLAWHSFLPRPGAEVDRIFE